MSRHASLRVAVYAGPTGGHLFPAQSFAECFREKFPGARLEMVTSRRARKLVSGMPEGLFKRIHYLPDFGLPHRILSFHSIKPVVLAPYLFAQAFFYLLCFRPRLCVGFGSFVAFPGMMMAKWFGVPTLIHEQNMVPGKATGWLAPFMDAVAVSFKGTKLRPLPGKVHEVGLPLRSFITDRPAIVKKRGGKLSILVVGGSQGSQGLNRIVAGAFLRLSREEREKIVVTHIAGAKDLEWIASQYEGAGLTNVVHPFYRNMFELFQKADIAVTRAGANTLFELAFYGIPAFVIPFPYAGGHQKLNAKAFADRGALEYHAESPEAVDWLAAKLRTVLNGEKNLKTMATAMTDLARPKAAEDLVALALEMIKK